MSHVDCWQELPLAISAPSGRGEPIKLALAAKGIEFDVLTVDYPEMKADRSKYPFAQCPR